MNRLQVLKAALAGSAGVVTLLQPAAAKSFDVPDGDLSAALVSYMKQSDVDIIYADNIVRGRKSRGAKGDYTETAALTQILRGTGLTAQTMPMNAISIVPAPEKPKPAQVEVAQADPPANPASPAPAKSVETVVVTAQKKTEDIQQVPIAITALSQKELTERQIAGGPDLVKEVPNLTFTKTNFTGYNLEIRGIGTQAISVTTDPAVAVAFNDIPFIRNHFFEQEFYDLQDAEVLRGPQGTLYGRNATAGVVNIQSARPTGQYEAMLSADMGNYSNRRLEAMLNLPIVGDILDLRIAGEWTKRDGYSMNDFTGQPIDGRDLWSGRATLGWKPASDVQIYLVWEHFSENDDRIRSGKQLCKTAPVPAEVDGFMVGNEGNNFYDGDSPYLSQGCEAVSLYSPQAFQLPNAFSLGYVTAPSIQGLVNDVLDPYADAAQSQNLRVIDSPLNPHYMAKNDTVELNTDWDITPALTLTSQTGYNHDSLYSTEDFNRFTAKPGLFRDTSTSSAGAQYQSLAPNGIFCDPQLGCSDTLVAEDLSDEHAWQLSQEFRLASNFNGPLNFSVGANYLHYETEENYYVFINTLTEFAAAPHFGNPHTGTGNRDVPPWVPGVSDDSQCLPYGFAYQPNPTENSNVLACGYVDPNPFATLNNKGHNYFLSQNPYVLNSYAGFGEAYYNVTSDLKLTGGLRWTVDDKHFLDIPSQLLTEGYGYPVTAVVDQQWSELTGRAVANWTPKLDFTDQTLVYGSYAHGYKGGGANPPGAALLEKTDNISVPSNLSNQNPIHPLTFKPEFIDAFELGAKNTLLDGALTLNGDVFFYNYRDYQISEIVDRTSINLNFNATVRGAELETSWEPVPGLKFSFAGGYENATLNNGDQAIDLMDRAAGNPLWIVVKPFVTQASNCILPDYVVAASLANGAFGLQNYCVLAYDAHLDPVTQQPYAANPGTKVGGPTIPSNYPGFDPVSSTATNYDPYQGANAGPAPNNGEGFDKQLGGNQLPNAPHFTTSLSAEYTIPVSEDWAATLHSDFYWQSQSWARVFNDRPYDKLRGYSNVNLSLILTSANGWQVMGYIKNIFDTTAITGDFLNSDDTGLATNIFLTDPRLFGVRVTKQLDQNDGFWGSDFSGYDFFTNLFSDADNGKPPLWIELGGQLERLNSGQAPFDPPYFDALVKDGFESPLKAGKSAIYGDDLEATISFSPQDSDWVVSGSIRYGRALGDKSHHQQKTAITHFMLSVLPPTSRNHFTKTAAPDFEEITNRNTETHLILDFQAGKDVGLGMFGDEDTVSVGLRIAQLDKNSNTSIHARADAAGFFPYVIEGVKIPLDDNYHNHFDTVQRAATFKGVGPSISWNAAAPFAGNEAEGQLVLDWGANAALLFGRQRARMHHHSSESYRYYKGKYRFLTYPPTQNAASNRSRSVVVPNLGGFLGISMKYNNAKVSFGYRADEFFGAMDGGFDTHKSENVGFFGPYAKISIGLGG